MLEYKLSSNLPLTLREVRDKFLAGDADTTVVLKQHHVPITGHMLEWMIVGNCDLQLILNFSCTEIIWQLVCQHGKTNYIPALCKRVSPTTSNILTAHQHGHRDFLKVLSQHIK